MNNYRASKGIELQMTDEQAIQYNKISELTLIGKVEESKEKRVRTVTPNEPVTTIKEDGRPVETI